MPSEPEFLQGIQKEGTSLSMMEFLSIRRCFNQTLLQLVYCSSKGAGHGSRLTLSLLQTTTSPAVWAYGECVHKNQDTFMNGVDNNHFFDAS